MCHRRLKLTCCVPSSCGYGGCCPATDRRTDWVTGKAVRRRELSSLSRRKRRRRNRLNAVLFPSSSSTSFSSSSSDVKLQLQLLCWRNCTINDPSHLIWSVCDWLALTTVSKTVSIASHSRSLSLLLGVFGQAWKLTGQLIASRKKHFKWWRIINKSSTWLRR